MGTPDTIRGHAYAASNFPVLGDVFNGLIMGDVIPIAPDILRFNCHPRQGSGGPGMDRPRQ